MKKYARRTFIITFIMLISFSCSKIPLLTIYGQTMGTWYTVKVHGIKNDDTKVELQQAIDSALNKINTSVNTYNPKSEISEFNAFSTKGVYTVSNDFMRVTRVAEQIYKNSQGAFDPTVKRLVELWGFGDNGVDLRPTEAELKLALGHVGFDKLQICDAGIIKNDPLTQLDFSAIAKGYGVDLVLEEIERLGYDNILVEIGGEVRVKGRNGTKPWRIGIAVPSGDNVANANANESIELCDMACATSGDYQQFYIENGVRYTHLINPKTGYPIRHEVTSVTVLAKNCMLADACATAAIVLGLDKGLEFIESMDDVEAYFIYRDGDKMKTVSSLGWNK